MLVQKNKRILYYDALRLAAIIAVIILHVVITPPLSFLNDPVEWWVTIVYKTFFLWAVPVFFMISGSLLLNKAEPISDIYFKRLPKIVIPFLFWNAIYIFFDISHNLKHTVLVDLKSILADPIIYHFWFIYTLIGFYVITPVLRIIVKNSKRTDFEYLLLVIFISAIIFPFFKKITSVNIDVPIPLTGSYLGFYLLGYYVTKFEIPITVRRLIYFLALISLPITIIFTYIYSRNTGIYDNFFHQPSNLTLIFPSIAIFIIFQKIPFRAEGLLANLNSKIDIGRVCFGIFFSHVALLGILEGGKLGFKLTEKIINPIFGVLINAFVVFIICFSFFFVLELLKKYKYIRFISKLFY